MFKTHSKCLIFQDGHKLLFRGFTSSSLHLFNAVFGTSIKVCSIGVSCRIKLAVNSKNIMLMKHLFSNKLNVVSRPSKCLTDVMVRMKSKVK